MKKPARYASATWAHVPASLQKAVESMRETRRGLYIHGTVGAGKTHMAYAIGEYVQDKMGLRVYFWNTTELLADIRDDFDRGAFDKKHREEELMEFRGLLILDDIGVEKQTEWVQEQFYRVINKRYEEMLPTIFTSNLPVKALGERLGDRTASRIIEMCDIVDVSRGDRRIEGVAKRV